MRWFTMRSTKACCGTGAANCTGGPPTGSRHRDPDLRAAHLDRAADPAAARAYLEAARLQAAAYRYDTAQRLAERGARAGARPPTASPSAACWAISCKASAPCRQRSAPTGMPWSRLPTIPGAAGPGSDAPGQEGHRDLDGAFADLERAEAAAVAHGLTTEEARCHFLRGNLFFPRGDFEGCLREHRRSLGLARRADAVEQEAAALGGLGDAEYVRAQDDQRASPAEPVRRARPSPRFRAHRGRQRRPDRPRDVLFPPQREALDQGLAAARRRRGSATARGDECAG